MYWSTPIRYVIWWFEDAIYILRNTPSGLKMEDRATQAAAKFAEHDELRRCLRHLSTHELRRNPWLSNG